MLESLSNGFTGLQTIRLASLLKRDPSIYVSEPAVRRCYTKQMFLIKFTKFTGNSCVGVSSIKFSSSGLQMFFKISVLKNYANSTGKNLSSSPFLIQLQALRPSFVTEHLQWLLQTVSGFQPATLLKKRLRQRCFYEDLLMNTFCVYLSILRNFGKTFEEFSKTFLWRFYWKLLLS